VNPAASQQRDPLLAFRKEFPILEKTNYLVSNSLGPMPRTVPEKLAEYARDWGELGVKAWTHGWWERPIETGNEIAPLINADEGEVVMMPNVTMGTVAEEWDLYTQRNKASSGDYEHLKRMIAMNEGDLREAQRRAPKRPQ